MNRLVAIVVCSLFVTACTLIGRTVVAPPQADSDLLFALVILAIDDYQKNGLQPVTHCIEVEGGNPSRELLNQVRSYSQTVVTRSACRERRNVAGYQYRERLTGNAAALVQVSIQKWLSPTSVEASYGWDRATLASHLVSVRLQRQDGHWVVANVLGEILS